MKTRHRGIQRFPDPWTGGAPVTRSFRYVAYLELYVLAFIQEAYPLGFNLGMVDEEVFPPPRLPA